MILFFVVGGLMAYEGCYHVWIFKAGVHHWITISRVSIKKVSFYIYLFTFLLLIMTEQFVLMVFLRIDSMEKFRERIPFMRSELKDDRMYFCLLTTPENDLFIQFRVFLFVFFLKSFFSL